MLLNKVMSLSRVIDLVNTSFVQLPKAKGFLKRLQRPNGSLFQEFQDDYVEGASDQEEFSTPTSHTLGWLLLVEIHIQNGKNDQAARLCQRIIQTDRSCNKVWSSLWQLNGHKYSCRLGKGSVLSGRRRRPLKMQLKIMSGHGNIQKR